VLSQQPRRGAPRRGAPRGNRNGVRNVQFASGKSSSRMDRTDVVTEDEYIAEVAGSTSTTVPTVTTYPYNPGQAGTFPWLSTEAKQWQKYATTSVEYYYKPEVSQFATNGTTGKVMLSFQYDAARAAPSTKQQIEDTRPRADGMPWETIRLSLNPRELNGQDSKYVRNGGLPGGSSIQIYDGGNLFVSTIGNQSTGTLGEIRCRYTIRFREPIIFGTVNAPQNNQVAQFNTTTTEASGSTTVATTLLLATAYANGIQAVNTSGSIVLPAGNYLLDAVNHCHCTADDITSIRLDIQYNGTSILPNATAWAIDGNGVIGFTDLTLSGSSFVSTNGTYAITLVATNGFTGGTMTNQGSLRITAV
jgi:hypothetical protein